MSLQIPVPVLTSIMMMVRGGTSGRSLGQEGGALRPGIGALMRGPTELVAPPAP